MKAARVVVDAFCLKQFTKEKGVELSAEQFATEVNSRLEGGAQLHDGYAPFCKHLFLDNFVGIPPFYLELSASNLDELRTDYSARESYELPVLRRFFPRGAFPDRAPGQTLDVILYSREQIEKETASRGEQPAPDADYEWSVVSFRAQDEPQELPMEPITMMRNALGKEEGGSGVALDRELYLASVKFWSEHAMIV